MAAYSQGSALPAIVNTLLPAAEARVSPVRPARRVRVPQAAVNTSPRRLRRIDATLARGGAPRAERSDAGAVAPLGTSANRSGELATKQGKRRSREESRQVAAATGGAEFLRDCGHKSVSAGGGVAVKGGGTGAAGYSGVATCGSVHACPVCAAKIGAVRADELGQAIRWAKTSGHTVAMLTLTVRHHAGEPLETVWERCTRGWEFVTAGWASESEKAYAKRVAKHEQAWADHRAGLRRRPRELSPRRVGAKERGGVLHWARAVEATQGENGWHVHLHVLVVLDRDVVPAGGLGADVHVVRLEESLFELWERGVTKAGGTVEREPATDLRIMRGNAEEVLAQYLTKGGDALAAQARSMAAEVTLGQFKAGRKTGNMTPFELVERIRTEGDADAVDRWREWVRVSRGRRALTWSQGFRAAAGLLDERSDEEIAAEEDGDGVVLFLPREAWLGIRGSVDRRCGLLDAVERGGVDAAADLLDSWGLPWSREPYPSGQKSSQSLT